MDDARRAGDGGGAPEDQSAAGSATGVFGVVAGQPPKSEAGSGTAGAVPPLWTPVAPPAVAQQIPAPMPQQNPVQQNPAQQTPVPVPRSTPVTAQMVQPVVHRVVVGGDASGKASDYDELLSRLRAGGAPGGTATPVPGVRKLPETGAAAPAKAMEATPPAVAAAPAAAEPNGGFTQLLRAMDADLVAPAGSGTMGGAAGKLGAGAGSGVAQQEPPAEMRPIAAQEIDLRLPGGGGFTALLRTLSPEKPVEKTPEAVPEVESVPEVKSAPVAAQAQAPVAAQAPVVAAALAEAQSAGSFTAMLRASSGEAADFGRGGAQPKSVSEVPVPEAVGQAPAPAQSSPGSFTEMFRAMDAKGANPGGGGGFGSAPVNPAPPPVAASVPSAGSPGTFTQMFRALDAKAEAAPGGAASAPPSAAPPSVAQSGPGTFTGLFRSLDSGASVGTPAAPVARVEPVAAAPQRGGEGSFTQMLSAQRPQDAPSYATPPEPQRAVPASGAWGVAPASASAQGRAGGGSAGFGDPLPREPERRPEPAGGGLTQLLRTLEGPGSASPPRRDEPPPMPPPAAGPGMFTQTYQRLDGRGAPGQGVAPPPAAAPVQAAPVAAPGFGATGFNQPAQPMAPPPAAGGGQSEFTRILDASRMREMGLRGGGGAVPGSGLPQAGPVAPPQMPQPPMPPMPPMPQPGMPQAPGGLPGYAMQPPAYPGGMPAYAPPPMAAPQMAMPPMAAPQVAPPAMPPAPTVQPPQASAPAAGTANKYLMPILIVAVFLLLVVVIALLFLMKH